jgi:hypothetical protein
VSAKVSGGADSSFVMEGARIYVHVLSQSITEAKGMTSLKRKLPQHSDLFTVY